MKLLSALARPSASLVIGFAAAAVLGVGVADAANGGYFVLGHTNYETVGSTISNTGTGVALALNTHATTTPPLAVSNSTKINRLNADLLDGVDSSSFERVVTGNLVIVGSSSPTWQPLVTVGSLGSIEVVCDSGGGFADLRFAKSASVSSVNIFYSRMYAAGGTTTPSVGSYVGNSSALLQFTAVANGATEQRVIQVGAATGRVMTATITLQNNINGNGNCYAVAQVV